MNRYSLQYFIREIRLFNIEIIFYQKRFLKKEIKSTIISLRREIYKNLDTINYIT